MMSNKKKIIFALTMLFIGCFVTILSAELSLASADLIVRGITTAPEWAKLSLGGLALLVPALIMTMIGAYWLGDGISALLKITKGVNK